METNEEYIKNLEKKRAQAISEGDRETYVKTTLELGYDIGEVPWLAEEPEEKEDLEEIVLENGIGKSLSSKLKRLYDIVNRSFSELQSGERISPKEYKQRLSELKKAGWPVKRYSEMRRREVKSCFSRVQQKINEKYEQVMSAQESLF